MYFKQRYYLLYFVPMKIKQNCSLVGEIIFLLKYLCKVILSVDMDVISFICMILLKLYMGGPVWLSMTKYI